MKQTPIYLSRKSSKTEHIFTMRSPQSETEISVGRLSGHTSIDHFVKYDKFSLRSKMNLPGPLAIKTAIFILMRNTENLDLPEVLQLKLIIDLFEKGINLSDDE